MSYFQKNFLHLLSVLGYLTKLEKDLGLFLVHIFWIPFS